MSPLQFSACLIWTVTAICGYLHAAHIVADTPDTDGTKGFASPPKAVRPVRDVSFNGSVADEDVTTDILPSATERLTTTGYGRTRPTPYYERKRKQLHIIGLFDLSGQWAGGKGQLPAVRLGIHHVNHMPGILDDYELVMLSNDTSVSTSFINKPSINKIGYPLH